MKIQTNNTIIIKSLLIIILPVILYYQDLTFLLNEAINSEVFTHVLAIPFMLIYILYRLRKVISASTTWNSGFSITLGTIPIKDIIGIILCTIAYAVKWYGSYTFLPVEYHIISLPLFISGLTIIIFNFETLRVLIFPIAFLIFLLPPPLNIIQVAGSALSVFSSQASYAITKFTGIPVDLTFYYDSPIIYLTTSSGQEISLTIDIACSGLYSLIGFALFAFFLAYITRGPLKNKALTLLTGFPVIYFLNILRIVLLIYIGYFFGPELALNTFHLFGGWILILLGTLLILLVSEKYFNIQLRDPDRSHCEKCNEGIKGTVCTYCGKMENTKLLELSNSEIMKILAVIIITLSLTTIQVPVFAFTNKGAEISLFGSQAEISTDIFPTIEDYNLQFVSRDRAFENISGQDASYMYMYYPTNQEGSLVWVGLEIGPTRACLHRWEGCLIDWPTASGREVRITKLDLRDIRLIDDPPLTARYFAFYWNETKMGQVVLYWFTSSMFETPNGYQEKIVKISVIDYPIDPTEYQYSEEKIYPFAAAIANHWTPISSWSGTALLLAKNSASFIMILIVFLASVTAYYFYEKRVQAKKVERIFNRITNPDETLIIQAVKDLTIEPKTAQSISSKIFEISGRQIPTDTIISYLHEADKLGIIKKTLLNKNDEPFVTWKK